MEKDIKAEDMYSCLCCFRATHFRMTPADRGLDDIKVVCPHNPNGDKLIDLAFGCSHFENIFRVARHLEASY